MSTVCGAWPTHGPRLFGCRQRKRGTRRGGRRGRWRLALMQGIWSGAYVLELFVCMLRNARLAGWDAGVLGAKH